MRDLKDRYLKSNFYLLETNFNKTGTPGFTKLKKPKERHRQTEK